MEPEIIEKKSFTVAGVQERFSLDNMEFETIWRKKFQAYHDVISSKSSDKAYYGVWFGTGQEGKMDYLAGMAVETGEGLPEEVVIREVPEARYAVFESKVKNIGETWDRIFKNWLPSSKYELNTNASGYEYYPPDAKDKESPVFIHLPIVEKE